MRTGWSEPQRLNTIGQEGQAGSGYNQEEKGPCHEESGKFKSGVQEEKKTKREGRAMRRVKQNRGFCGVPGGIRTHDPLLRSYRIINSCLAAGENAHFNSVIWYYLSPCNSPGQGIITLSPRPGIL